MFTALPVRAAAAIRSVCRERNAGIWSTSTTGAATAACHGSWISVNTGSPVRERISVSTSNPASSPGPRNEEPDVRFALSYDALYTRGTPVRTAISRRASARSMAWAALSMTQGPAMNTSGRPPPMDSGPMLTGFTPTL